MPITLFIIGAERSDASCALAHESFFSATLKASAAFSAAAAFCGVGFTSYF